MKMIERKKKWTYRSHVCRRHGQVQDSFVLSSCGTRRKDGSLVCEMAGIVDEVSMKRQRKTNDSLSFKTRSVGAVNTQRRWRLRSGRGRWCVIRCEMVDEEIREAPTSLFLLVL
jgi:hypothetical protein